MKKTLIVALMALAVTGASAKTAKDSTNSNKPVFTVIKELPVTSMKDQNKSGTCWAYSTLSFFESEILKNSGKTYDLSEMFVANKTYMDRATKAVSVLYCLKNYGIVPENAMPAPGTLIGDSLANFDEFFEVMTPYVEGIAKSKASKISSAWKNGLQGILDAYLGEIPESFSYEGKTYTPQSFVESLGLNLDDYVTITSYTHHPMWSQFAAITCPSRISPASLTMPWRMVTP